MALHLADLDGAHVACRNALADELRSYGDDYVSSVFGDSRGGTDERDAIALALSRGLSLVAVIHPGSMQTLRDEDDYTARIRRYGLPIVFARQWGSGEGEDDFMTQVERVENRLAARSTLTVTVDEVDIDFEFAEIDEDVEHGFTFTENYEVSTHRTVRRVWLERRACA